MRSARRMILAWQGMHGIAMHLAAAMPGFKLLDEGTCADLHEFLLYAGPSGAERGECHVALCTPLA